MLICWQRCTCIQSSQLQGRLIQTMALWNASHSQAVRQHAKIGSVVFSVKKNVKPSDMQNATCFVSLGRQLQCRRSRRGNIPNVKSKTPSHQKFSCINWNLGSVPRKIGGAFGLDFAVSGVGNAECPVDSTIDSAKPTEASTSSTHGKKVYSDYSVTGIPGDGRCMFRSVVNGACIRSGKPIPNEDLQRKLADELRTMVADEFIKTRAETEWFVEGDFDTYVSRIREPHVWGGEPKLFMASHVLH